MIFFLFFSPRFCREKCDLGKRRRVGAPYLHATHNIFWRKSTEGSVGMRIDVLSSRRRVVVRLREYTWHTERIAREFRLMHLNGA